VEEIIATEAAKLTLADAHGSRTVPLYSEEGVELVAALWVKLITQYRLMYQVSWLGVPIIQLPSDIVMMQELIWKIRPDVIVESGVAHGGSAVLYASMCELLGRGRVVGVDIEIREPNRVALTHHPLAPRIQLIEGSSIDPEVFRRVKEACQGAATVLVVLDANHTAAHVNQELLMYSELVTPGSYIVAMDGAQAQVWDIPRGKKEWRDDSPIHAIRHFLAGHPEFEVDPHFTRMRVTANPEGFLRRRTRDELAR